MACVEKHGCNLWDLPLATQLADALAGRPLPNIQYRVHPSQSWEWMAVLFDVHTGTYPSAQDWNTDEAPLFDARARDLAEKCHADLKRYIQLFLQVKPHPNFRWLCKFRVLYSFANLIRRGVLNHGPMMGWAIQSGDSFYEEWDVPMPRRQNVAKERGLPYLLRKLVVWKATN